MLWTVAAGFFSGVGHLIGFLLMVTGSATCIWLGLSNKFPFLSSKRALGFIFCGVLLLGIAWKLIGGSEPESATAATASVAPAASPAPAAAQAAQPAPGSVGPDKAADKAPTDGATIKVAKSPKTPSADDLADRYTDKSNGYSIRFPSGWATRTFANGDPWFIDVSDGKAGLISVGFSVFPSSAGLEQLKPEKLANGFRGRPHTAFTAQGKGTVDGREAVWFRYTAPIDTPMGRQLMDCVHYYVPLHDGRMMEVRMAAAPDKFATLGALLRKSTATIKLQPL